MADLHSETSTAESALATETELAHLAGALLDAPVQTASRPSSPIRGATIAAQAAGASEPAPRQREAAFLLLKPKARAAAAHFAVASPCGIFLAAQRSSTSPSLSPDGADLAHSAGLLSDASRHNRPANRYSRRLRGKLPASWSSEHTAPLVGAWSPRGIAAIIQCPGLVECVPAQAVTRTSAGI